MRVPVELSALLQFHDGATARAMITNLSIDGCEIHSERGLERGETCTLQISGFHDTGMIEVEVTAVHTARPQTAGLKFLRLSELGREEIGRFLYIRWKAWRRERQTEGTQKRDEGRPMVGR